jgi:hypothetical protein
MIKTNNQNGFFILGAVLVGAVIVGVVSVGLYVWHGTNNKDDTISTQTNAIVSDSNLATVTSYTGCVQANGSINQQSSPKTCTTKDGKKFTEPAYAKGSGQKYISITEWGIRIPYSGSDTYTYKLSATRHETINIVSKNLANNYDCTSSGAGMIARRKAADAPGFNYLSSEMESIVEKDAAVHPSRYVHLGNFYYAFLLDPVVCSNKIMSYPSGLEAASKVEQTVNNLMSNIEPIPS